MKTGLFIAVLLLLYSCGSNPNEEFTEEETMESFSFEETREPTKSVRAFRDKSIFRIKYYRLKYNAKATGRIDLQLENGAKYSAERVDGGSLASVSLLLKENEVLFDTIRKEFIVEKTFLIEITPNDLVHN